MEQAYFIILPPDEENNHTPAKLREKAVLRMKVKCFELVTDTDSKGFTFTRNFLVIFAGVCHLAGGMYNT